MAESSPATSSPSRPRAGHWLSQRRAAGLRYAAALAAWGVALALTLALAPYLQRAVFVFFWVAILFAAWSAGFVPALIGAVAAVVAVNYYVIPPRGGFAELSAADLLTLAIFVGASGLVSALAASLVRAQREMAESANQLQDQAVELEQQTEEAQALAEELEEANEQLQRTTAEAEAARLRVTAVLDSLADIVTAYDRDWRWTYLNPASREVHRARGLDPDATIGRVVWDALPRLRGTRFEREAKRAAAEGRTVEYEEYAADLDAWFETRVVPGDDGTVTVYARDVSERHRGVEAVRASEARYRALVEASTRMVWHAAPDGRMEEMPGWSELTGQSLDEVRRRGWTDAVHPADRERVAGLWRRALEARDVYEAEFRLRLAGGGFRWFRARGAPVLDADGALREWVGVFDDIDDERRAEEARDFLERASEALAAALTVDDALATVARTAVESPAARGETVADAFADGVAIDLPRPGGGFRRVAVESRDPAKTELVNAIERAYPTPEDAPAGYARVIRTGEAELIEDFDAGVLPALARDERHLSMLRAIDMYSAMVVPLRARGETLGAITLVLTGPARRRSYDRRDLAVAEELARRAGIALDNAIRYEAERAAGERARRLLAVSAGLNEATTREEAADVIFREGMAAVNADAGSLAFVHTDSAGGQTLEIVRTHGYAQRFVDAYRRFPLRAGRPLSDAVLSRAPLLLESRADWERQYPEVAREVEGLGYEAFAAVPVVSGARVLAAVSFSFRSPVRFDDATRTFLATLGEQCGLALDRARAFEAERGAREFSSSIIASIRDGFVAFDRDFRYTYVNARAAEMLGLPPDEILGRVVWELMPGVADSEFGRAFRRAMGTQEPVTLEEYSEATGGWVEVRVYPSSAGLTVFFQDVTARRRAQDARAFLAEASRLLNASLDYETTLRAVAEAAVPALGDWCAVDIVRDPGAGTWPPRLDRLAVVHRDPQKVALGAALQARYPTDWSAPGGMAAVLRDNTPLFVPRVTEEMVVAGARDAEHLAMLRAIQFSSIIAVPLVARGRTLGALTLCATESGRHYDEADLALAQDLAERAASAVDNARLYRDAERARAAAEADAERVELLQDVTAALSRAATREEVADVVVDRLSTALGATVGVLALLTPDGERLAVAAARTPPAATWREWETFDVTAAVPLAEAVRTGAPVTLSTFDEIAARSPVIAGICADSGTQALCVVPVVSERRVLGSFGMSFAAPRAFPPELLTFLATLAAQCAQALERAQLYEAEHAARAESEAARSEAEAARRAAEAANSAKSDFLAVMSHELRTPLNAIGGYAELLEMEIRGPVTGAQREDLERIKRSQQRLLSLINDVLSFARIDAGQVRFDVAAVPLVDALSDVEALLLPQTRAKGLAFEVRRPAPDIVVRADRERLEQIVINLLSNAVKFTAPGGRVTLACEANGDKAFVRVTDTGRGVPVEQLEAIFQPFVQVEAGHTRTAEGTGLGLAISRDLARGMGGELSAESAVGVGSTFTLTLPRV